MATTDNPTRASPSPEGAGGATPDDSPVHGLSRRHVLGGTAALLAVASAAGAGAFLYLDPPAPGFALLSPAEVLVATALGEALFPPGNPLGVSARDVDIALRLDELLHEYLDPALALPTRYLLRGFEVGTTASRHAAFATLPLAVRADVATVWSDPTVLPRRLAFDALRSVLSLAFFLDPRAVAATGWTHICNGGPA